MKVHREKGIVIIAPHGWLMGGAETDDLEKTIRDLLEEGNRCLVVDLGDVQMMNSMAIGALVGFRTSYVNRQGRMTLCNLDKKMDKIFVVTKLSLIFDVYSSVREAIASFGGSECPEGK